MHSKMRLFSLSKRQFRNIGLFMIICMMVFSTFVSSSVLAFTPDRVKDRELYMNSARASDTTYYKMSFRYDHPLNVGSIDMMFCTNPIPYLPCETPPGLDVSGATLSDQTGETGFAIAQKSGNHILLSRTPSVVVDPSNLASYKFENIKNPSIANASIAIRIRIKSSMDGTGQLKAFGSIRGRTTRSIVIETQVPPMLIFCLARHVEMDCSGTDEVYYDDMGELSPETTLSAHSEMAVGTNATAGFVIQAFGTTMSAGTNIIDPLTVPTVSQIGVNQFGINLIANDEPNVGHDPEGPWTNAKVAPGYDIPNMYKFVSGDIVASAPHVSLMKKFTVSYIVNSSTDLHPGVYTTTINFIASGRF